MDSRLSEAAAQHDLQTVLELFFQLKDEGLTAQKLDRFLADCHELGGSLFREQVEEHIRRYAAARSLRSTGR